MAYTHIAYTPAAPVYAPAAAPVPAAAATIAPNWRLDRGQKRAVHSSGLSVQYDAGGFGRRAAPSLNIEGIDKLAGTPWVSKVSTLVEEAILLLDGG